VRESLGEADWVSVKVDAGDEATWMRLNRPHPDLDFTRLREGITRFAGEYEGELVTETMLIEGVNDSSESIAAVAELLADVGASRTYLAIPTRPTPYSSITAPDESTVNRAYHLMVERLPAVEYLVGYEGDEFASTGDPKADLLSITAVHPMRASAVSSLLERSGAGWEVVRELVDEEAIVEVSYRSERFYSRRWRR
jgi:wyosine [tRNA(Phe)-imidazoG37] synthetase (radical SAM superfamily)